MPGELFATETESEKVAKVLQLEVYKPYQTSIVISGILTAVTIVLTQGDTTVRVNQEGGVSKLVQSTPSSVIAEIAILYVP